MNEKDTILYGLNERQKKAIKHIFARGKITNSDYVELFKVSRTTASNDLMELINKGLVERIGKGRGSCYLPKI